MRLNAMICATSRISPETEAAAVAEVAAVAKDKSALASARMAWKLAVGSPINLATSQLSGVGVG